MAHDTERGYLGAWRRVHVLRRAVDKPVEWADTADRRGRLVHLHARQHDGLAVDGLGGDLRRGEVDVDDRDDVAVARQPQHV